MIKKGFYFPLVTFMFLPAFCFAQDSLRNSFSHLVGFGIIYTPNTSYDDGYTKSNVAYTNPGANLFYRFLIANKNKHAVTAFTSNFFYRRGSVDIWTGTGSHFSYTNYSGTFEFVKWNQGVSRFGLVNVSKRISLSVGGGFESGLQIYAKGNIKEDSYYITSGNVSPNHVISSLYLALNMELNFTIKLSTNHSLILGVKQFFETSDVSTPKNNLSTNGFIAFKL